MINIVVPELGESVLEARIARWLKKVGDRVSVGDPLVELETEKINLEVNAERGGVISGITRQEGEDVKIGDVMGTLDESASASPAQPSAAEPSPAPPSPAKPSPAPPTPAPVPVAAPPAAPVLPPPPTAKPAPAAPQAAAVSPARTSGGRPEVRQRMTKRRETIARRLVEAQHNAAMLTTFNEVDMTAVMGLRERHKEAF
jgi:2-oxoglutarate dehydrogenase E2 component (dihydrolipoamide succinyltransferase)